MLKLSNGVLTAEVNPIGAELSSLRTADSAEWLWQGNPAHWASRAPILFPVIGRSAGGHILISGLPHPMPSHGIARANAFRILEHHASRCRLRLTDTPETRVSYPFAFQLDIAFALSGASISVGAEITNTGAISLPCSFGFHPGFVWPLPGSAERPHVVTLAGGREPRTRRIDGQGGLRAEIEPSLFTRGRLTPTYDLFARDAIIIDEDWGGHVTFGIERGPLVEVVAEGLPNLGIWTRPAAPFLCLEPWHGLPALAAGTNAIETRPSMMHIAPSASRTLRMTIAAFAPG